MGHSPSSVQEKDKAFTMMSDDEYGAAEDQLMSSPDKGLSVPSPNYRSAGSSKGPSRDVFGKKSTSSEQYANEQFKLENQNLQGFMRNAAVNFPTSPPILRPPVLRLVVDQNEEDVDDTVDGGNGKEYVEMQPVDPLADHTPTDHADGEPETEGNPGWASPISSQGSMESGEYLEKNLEGIQKNEAFLNTIQQIPIETIVSKDVYRGIQSYVNDDHGIKGLLQFVNHNIMSTLHCSEAFKPGTDNAKNMAKKLEEQDPRAILGVLGRVLTEKFCARNPENQSQPGAASQIFSAPTATPSTSFQWGFPNQSGRELSDELFPNTPGTSRALKRSCTDSPSVIPVPAFKSEVEAKKSRPSHVDEKGSMISLPDKALEDAFDQVLENQFQEHKQAEKAGQVFFDALFTTDEVLQCTLGGKRGTKSFDSDKVRLLKRSVSFVMSKPKVRSSQAFLQALEEQAIEELENCFWATIKTKVLTEHAYRKRQKIVEQRRRERGLY